MKIDLYDAGFAVRFTILALALVFGVGAAALALVAR